MIASSTPSAPALGRPQAALVAALLSLAVLAWWGLDRRMGDMSSSPGADLGGIGLYTSLWVLMMAAMMFPAIAPVVVTYDRLRAGRRARGARCPGPEGSALFVAGYLVSWTALGLFAYGLLAGTRSLVDDGVLAWDRLGQEVVAAVLMMSAGYQLTSLKDRCLAHCRGPLMYLLEHWSEGRIGAVRMGLAHGAWCVGCCWMLMAALFALGLMSLGWMAFVAALIAGEKLLPARLNASRGAALVLLALGIAVLVEPGLVPGLVDRPSAQMGM